MKNKLVLIGMLLFIVDPLVTSCTKDDENAESVSIVGDWECVTAASQHYCYYDEIGGTLLLEKDKEYDDWIGERWKLTSDGKFYRQGRDRGNYVQTGNLLVFEEWEKEFTIVSVSKEKLIVMEYRDGYTELEELNWQRVFYQKETTIEFKRL